MKVLIDTNVVIDALQRRDSYAGPAELIMVQAYKYNGYIVATSATDIYYLQRKYYHDKLKAKTSLEKVLKLYEVVDVTEFDCRNALRSNIPDYEDAVLVESAVRKDMDIIITRNTKDFQNSPVPAYTPAEFLAFLASDHLTKKS